MSMTIGNDAREAIYQLVHQSTQECSGLLEILDRCTDAPEVTLPTLPSLLWAVRGWREWDEPEGLTNEERILYGACRSIDAMLARWLKSARQKGEQG